MISRTTILLFTCLVAIIPILGCGGPSSQPVSPGPLYQAAGSEPSRQLWGLWNVEVIPDGNGSAQLVFTPLRSAEVHLNVVKIMEAGGGTAVGINPPVTLVDGILDVEIRLTHPFDIPKFTGFDVRGILIGHGSIGGFSQSLFYAGDDDIELLNPDGHTRLWNPTEYTGKGYVDGKLGKPDAIANYTATLNGYKYFADSLTPDMDVPDMLKADRGAFMAGSTNARHYTIRLGNQGLTFQYAIDANWWAPTEPVEVPDSFDVQRANCPEPYHIDAWIGPGITGDGGSASMTVDVYDWQKDVDTAYVEAPLLFDDVLTLTIPQDFGDFVRFSTTITNQNLPAGDKADVLVYATGVDPVSTKTHTDYHLYHLPVPHLPAGGVIITIQDDKAYKTIGIEYEYGGTDYDYAGGNPAPVDYNDHSGPWDFTPVPATGTAIRKALAKTDPEVAGFAGDFSPNVTHFFKTEAGINGEPSGIYQAEAHNEGANLLRLWGIYSEVEIVEGVQSIPLDPPIDFTYPMDINTHYQVSKNYTIIPFLLTFKVTFERWGMGQGIAFVPVEPGVNGWGWVAQAALETRTEAAFETGGALGQGPMGTALVYEWIADDGTMYGSVTAGNSPDEAPNYDESTYEITGTAGANALRSIS